MLCHDWLGSRHLVVGTKTGKALLLEDAELRATVDLWAKVQQVAPDAGGGGGGGAGGGGQMHMNVRE